MNWYLEPLKHSFDWQGRATRKEYWLFYAISSATVLLLLGLVVLVAAGSGDTSGLTGLSWVWIIYVCYIGVATIALTVRRLHDIDKSGWYQLLFLIPLAGVVSWLVFMCTEGTKGNNQYGALSDSPAQPSQTNPAKTRTASPASAKSADQSPPIERTNPNTPSAPEDPEVADLRKKLAAAEAAAEQKAEAQNLQRARDDVVARIKNLEEALADAEIQIEQLKKPDNS